MTERTAGIYKFRADNQNYIFHRDSLCVLRVPHWPPPDSDKEKIELVLNRERSNVRDVGPLTLRTIALNVTNRCNFACDYCFANQGNFDNPGLEMSEEKAQRAIDLLFKNVSENQQARAAIAFFGGEPLLNWDLIKMAVTYAEKNRPGDTKLKFLITSNASLMDREKVEFFKGHNFSVMVSLDGPKDKHDKHRRFKDGLGTYDAIIGNILYANEMIPLTFRATITDDNLDLVRVVEHFRELKALTITFGVDNDHLKKINYAKLITSYKMLADYYYQDIMARNFYEVTNLTEVFLQIAFRERKVSHCNAGLSYMGVSADGSLYKCPRFTGSVQHKFGDIDQEEEIAARRDAFLTNLKNARERSIECSRCSFTSLCGGLCHYDLFKKGKNDDDVSRELCLIRKTVYAQALKLYVKIPDDIKGEFLLFLSR